MSNGVKVSPKEVLIVMGSQSDWPTMKLACDVLEELQVGYDTRIISAHRTPERIRVVARESERQGKFKVIIAGAGGAAHLPGMMASECIQVPVLGVPIQSKALNGMDSLLSIVQMPAGVPVGTLAIGEAGAKNAAHLAIQILALSNRSLRVRYRAFREKQTNDVPLRPV